MRPHTRTERGSSLRIPWLARRAWLSAALSVLALWAAGAPAAQAHGLGADSVDCTIPWDCEIRWEDQTRFDGARRFAIGQWNRLGRVDIVPDTATSIADLEFVDYKDCDAAWEAFWSPRGASDVIGFNPCKITDRRTRYPPDPNAAAVHELGHALRLAHPSGSYWRTRSIMYACARCTPTSTYHAHDVGDYRRTW